MLACLYISQKFGGVLTPQLLPQKYYQQLHYFNGY